MKILFLSPSKTDSCSFYRAGGVAPGLERMMNGTTISVLQWDQIIISWQTILNYDLIMLQRPFLPEHLQVCEYVKNAGVPLWLDYDDNLLAVPPENPRHELYNAQVREYIKKMLTLADVVSVPTEELKREFSAHNQNVTVIPNAFNDYIFKNSRNRLLSPQRSPTILWRGSDTHIFDLMTVIDEVSALAAEYKQWQFMFMGFFPWFIKQNENNNIFRLPGIDVLFYFKNGYAMRPYAMYTPLSDNPFNRAKSNIAWIEGSYFGAVSIVPDWEEWQKPGALTFKTPAEFREVMTVVLSGKLDTAAHVGKSWEYIQDCLMLSKVNVKRLELINRLV